MGKYLNPTSQYFKDCLGSAIYIDKSMLLALTNRRIHTQQKYICVTHPRWFGKTMALEMLSAYYGCGEDTSPLFDDLKIVADHSYREHLNRYDVIRINLQIFLDATCSVSEMIAMLEESVISEVAGRYENVEYRDGSSLPLVMKDIFNVTGNSFVILIDDWDCPFQRYKHNYDALKMYHDFLRYWLKDQDYVALAYMTGMLPIKKFGSHSSLDMFMEYSMTRSGHMAPYFGFTAEEVKALCDIHNMDFTEARFWYEGYPLITYSQYRDTKYVMYNPKSVVEALLHKKFSVYWNESHRDESFIAYTQMNIPGLQDAVSRLVDGESVPIYIGTFLNDMTSLKLKDDVLTLLVHMGYLSYDEETNMVSIPNYEVRQIYNRGNL